MTGSNRVIRGGSWNNNANNCRSAQRNNLNPDNRITNIGFRLASSPHRPTARVHGCAPSAPVVTRAAIPRPATGTNSTAPPAGQAAGRGGPFARRAALVLTLILAAAAPHPARADTAYSGLFAIDLRTPPTSNIAYSNLFSIDLRVCGALQSPTLTAPASKASGWIYLVTWTATNSDGAYELQEASDDTFADAQTYAMNATGRSFSHAPAFTSDYSYRVRARYTCGSQVAWSPWSEVARTTVTGGPAPALTLHLRQHIRRANPSP